MDAKRLASNDNEDIVEDDDFVAHRAKLSESENIVEGDVPLEVKRLASNDNEDIVEDDD